MRVAPTVKLTNEQRHILEQWARARSLPARQVEWAQVVLRAAAGKQDLEIAAELGISNQKAAALAEAVSGKRDCRIGKRRATRGQNSHDYADQGAGGNSKNHAGKA